MTHPSLSVRCLHTAHAADATPTVESRFRENTLYAYSIALRIFKQSDEAEDLLQDLYLLAAKDLRDLSHPLAVRRWFALVTSRLAVTRLRRRGFVAFLEDCDGAGDALVSPRLDPEQHAMLRSLLRVLDGGPEEVRIAWQLRYLEGLELELIAARCGCSLATAKRRIFAAERAIEAATESRLEMEAEAA